MRYDRRLIADEILRHVGDLVCHAQKEGDMMTTRGVVPASSRLSQGCSGRLPVWFPWPLPPDVLVP